MSIMFFVSQQLALIVLRIVLHFSTAFLCSIIPQIRDDFNCFALESRQRRGWNPPQAVCPQPKGLHGINPKAVRLDTRFARCHTRLCRNSIQRASALITYQSFGLDKKIPRTTFSEFFWQGQKDSNPRPLVLETSTLPTELYPYARGVLYHIISHFARPF